MTDVTVCVATYGGLDWMARAATVAVPSALDQGCPVVRWHGDDLASARNGALRCVETPWVVFLDADDELAPGYVSAMASASGDLRAPRLQFVHEDGSVTEPFDLTKRDMSRINPCAIGTAVRKADVMAVGGWRDWPAFEDFDLFRRMWLAGGRIEHVPDAVYRAHKRTGSRNDVPNPARLTKRIIDSHEER